MIREKALRLIPAQMAINEAVRIFISLSLEDIADLRKEIAATARETKGVEINNDFMLAICDAGYNASRRWKQATGRGEN